MKMLIVIGTVAIAGPVGWHWFAASGHKAGAPSETDSPAIVATASVKRETLAKTIRLTAEFRPYQHIDVHAKVTGFVKSIPVDIGDQVKTGDVLATLEIPELREDLKKSAAGVNAAREAVKQADANYQVAHADFSRLQQVSKDHPKLVAQQEIDTAAGKDQAAAAGLANTRQQVEEALAEQSRQLALVDYSKITAPFDGVVTQRYADVGALIQAGTSSNTQPIVSLAQENVLRVTFPVPESAVSTIKKGASVEIEVTGLGRSVHGTVTRFSRELNRETRAMETEVDVPNDDLSITPGMYGWAELCLENHQDSLGLPVEAVAAGVNPTVFLIGKDNRLEERPVKLGMETASQVEILDGLQQNDLVYIGNRGQVRAGMRVTPKINPSQDQKNG